MSDNPPRETTAPPPARTITEGPMAGWSTWREMSEGRFSDTIGPVYFRERPASAGGGFDCRSLTDKSHSNMQGYLHGGYLMSFIDQVMFACARPALSGGRAVTLTCNTEFVGAGIFGKPLDGSGEIVRATGRTIFMRGLVTQDDATICNWSGVLRKFKPKG